MQIFPRDKNKVYINKSIFYWIIILSLVIILSFIIPKNFNPKPINCPQVLLS